jgi:hypothetical protein
VPPQPRHASLNGGELRSSSGSLAMLAAMRRASSRVSSLAAARRARLLLEIDVGERLPGRIADDEAGVRRLDGLGRRLTLKAPHQ